MLGARLDDDTVVGAPLASAATSSRRCSSSAGRPRTYAGYVDGEAHAIDLARGRLDAARLPAARPPSRSGTAAPASSCCPCGAGKTLVGAAAMAQAPGHHADPGHQHGERPAVAGRAAPATSLTEDEIGEYSGARKEIRPVTIATYQVMTTRRKGVYAHLELFDARDWGLIVYDEVHLLPAPIFRMTADLQARRRLGLTATLVREDGREGDVFSLIGPKRYDAPWKDIEAQGWIAPADCVEVRVTLPEAERLAYAHGRARGALPAGRVHPRQDRGSSSGWSPGTPASRRW